MSVGKSTLKKNESHIEGFRQELDNAVNLSSDAFFSWFNEASNKEESFVNGNWDFATHISSKLYNYFNTTTPTKALEIGYGGGRLIAAASNYFDKVIGVDIHNNKDLVAKELQARGISNFELLKTDTADIQLSDSSLDLVYSFIVFQHLQKLEILESYLQETRRVLKEGSFLVIYFGRMGKFSQYKSSRLKYYLDILMENIWLPSGFQEIDAKVNEVNLVLTKRFAAKLLKKYKFKILGHFVSTRKNDTGKTVYGGQHGFLAQKIS